jgi:CBS domain-containing protein
MAAPSRAWPRHEDGGPGAVKIDHILQSKGRDIATVGPEETLGDAARTLVKHGVGALVVCSDDGEPLGIISERDIVRGLAASGARSLVNKVESAMTRELITCPPSADVDEVLGTMTTSRIRHVPVMDEGEMVGIVSIGDLVKSRIDELEVKSEALQEYVQGTSY